MSFPKDFIWGVATSSYQIEGAVTEGGRQSSVWDEFSHEKGKTEHGENGDISCDHYHHYKEDIQILKSLGIKNYRLSISWSRVLSYKSDYKGEAVKGEVNSKGLEFYDNVINELLANDITPWVTLFHWDLPMELERKGGWRNRDIMYWAADYAELIVKHFGKRVTHYFTINEMPCVLGGYCGWMAPGLVVSQKEQLNIVHNLLLTQGNMARAIRKNLPEAQIGFAHNGNALYPATDSEADIKAMEKAIEVIESSRENYAPEKGTGLFNGTSLTYWCDPIFLGHYPEEAFTIFKNEMPKIEEGDMEIISTPLDFVAYNTYEGACISATSEAVAGSGVACDTDDFCVIPFPQGIPRTAIKWPITPRSMRYFNEYICKRYKKPLYITENGMSNADVISKDGKVHDEQRISFTESYLHNLSLAIEDGANIKGYFHWSLLDNFEWSRGYQERFGMVYVDYQTQKRTIKDSALWYKNVIATNGSEL